MKKVGGFIRNCVEQYIPAAAFVILFVVFVFQVCMRYVMRAPQAWTTEVEQSCFLWLVMLGACYAQRVKGHVTFTLVYDNLGIKGKAITAMLGNILITFTFLPELHLGPDGAPAGDYPAEVAQDRGVFPLCGLFGYYPCLCPDGDL